MNLERVHPDDFLRRINEVKVKMPTGQPYYMLT